MSPSSPSSIAASLDAPFVTVEPGGEADLFLQVLNSGSTVEEYRFAVVGPCAAWTTIEPESLTLYPEASGSVTIRLRPPRNSQVTAGQQALGVRVVQASGNAEAVVPEATVTVLPFAQITAELLPLGSHSAWRGRHKVAVDSLGNLPITVRTAARGGTEKARCAVEPDSLEIAPGAARLAKVKVRPTKRLWRGTPVTHPFQVVVTPDADPDWARQEPVVLDGSYEQQPILPRWLPRAIIAAVVVAAVLVGLWFSVLRPTVRSAAKEAVTPAVVESAMSNGGNRSGQNPENPGQSPGASNGGAGGGGGAAGPSSGAGAPAGEVGGPGLPTSARVQVRDAVGSGSSTRTAYQVPSGKTFGLTDIVVQNPQGDAGTVIIANQGGGLLTLALENFRDSDYHFVTPVEVSAGGKITIAVECRQVGKPVKLSPAPSQCSESLFLGGSLTAAEPTSD